MKSFDIVQHYTRFGTNVNGHFVPSGSGLILKGRVRSGKTYLIGIIAKLMLNKGWNIITNVRFANDEFVKYSGKLHYITSDLEFFKSYIEIEKTEPILLIWDDAQASQGFKSTHTIRKSGDMLQTFLIFIGKLDCNYLIVMHNYLIPDVLIDGFEPLWIYKLAKENFWVGSREFETDYDIRMNCVSVPVPEPSRFQGLQIVSKAIAMFEWKLDLPAMFSHCSKFEYADDLRTGIKDFLDSNADENPYAHLEKLTWTDITIAIKLKKPDVSGSMKLYEIINPNVLYSALKKV